MPIYEYRCMICGNEFEIFVRGSESEICCPGCATDNVTKKFSVFGFKSGGAPMATSSGGHSCGGCSSHNCGGCHH